MHYWHLWRDEVLPYLQPTDLVRLTHVCQKYSRRMRRNDIWERWLKKIGEGPDGQPYMEELQECKTLTFLGKGYMDAYIAATSCKCAECGAWTMYVCVLTLRPTCFGCFETWCKTHLMSKTKAQLQYLLTTEEMKSLPLKMIGDNTQPMGSIIFVVHDHAELLATRRYRNRLEGLEEDRRQRKKKAQERRGKVIEAYEKRRAAALKAGKKAPKYPKESSLLSSDISLTDSGCFSGMSEFTRITLTALGFRRKNEPTSPIDQASDSILSFFRCTHYPQTQQYRIAMYPSRAELNRLHANTCEHKPPSIRDGY